MYSFTFHYENDINRLFQHIVKAQYYLGSRLITVSGDELSSHCFPLKSGLHIFSESANYSVSGNQLRFIDIVKEN